MEIKKIYQTPQLEIIEIETSAIISLSNPTSGDNGMDDLPSEPGHFGF